MDTVNGGGRGNRDRYIKIRTRVYQVLGKEIVLPNDGIYIGGGGGGDGTKMDDVIETQKQIYIIPVLITPFPTDHRMAVTP
jgi:heptaprenylglyceryl phosphate synthase